MASSQYFLSVPPPLLVLRFAGLAKAKNQQGKVLRLIQTLETLAMTTVNLRINWEMLPIS